MRSLTAIVLGAYLAGWLAAAQASESDWAFDAFYNPVADARTFSARVDAEGSSLELRCSNRDPATQLRLRLPTSGNTNVSVNFDSQRPQQMVWLPSINGQSLRLSTEFIKDFSRRLRVHNVLTVKVGGEDEVEPIEISLRGSAKAIRSLSRHCRFI